MALPHRRNRNRNLDYHLGLTIGGWLRFTFFPAVDADNVVAYVTMPQGTPARVTAEAVATLEESANQVLRAIEERTGRERFCAT